MGRRSSAVAALLAVGFLTAGCEDPANPLDEATFAFDEDRLVMEPGGTLVPAFHGFDGAGRSLAAGDVTWSSADPTTADIERGVVTAYAPGVVLIRGQVGDSRDSVRVRVRVPDLGEGEVAARAQGSTDPESVRFQGAAFFSESIIGQFESRSMIMPISGEVDPTRSLQAEIRLPGRLEPGARTLDVLEVEELGGRPLVLGTEGVALYRLRSLEPLRWELWVGVGSPELEIEEVEYPVGPGLAWGRVQGNLSVEAAGLVVEGVGQETRIVGQVADSTVRFYIELEVPLRHSVSGGGSVEPGGRLGGEAVVGSGYAFLREGALATSLAWVTPPADPSAPVQYVGTLETWWPDPAVGTVDVPASGAEVLGPGGWEATVPWVRARFRRLENLQPGPEEWAVATSGTLAVADYDAPTELLTGLMEGSLEATLEVWADGQPTGEIIPFSGTFVLPVYPEGWPGGWP